jgi:hypothetical protein
MNFWRSSAGRFVADIETARSVPVGNDDFSAVVVPYCCDRGSGRRFWTPGLKTPRNGASLVGDHGSAQGAPNFLARSRHVTYAFVHAASRADTQKGQKICPAGRPKTDPLTSTPILSPPGSTSVLGPPGPDSTLNPPPPLRFPPRNEDRRGRRQTAVSTRARAPTATRRGRHGRRQATTDRSETRWF